MAVTPSFRSVTIRYAAETMAVKTGSAEAAKAVEDSAKRQEQAAARAAAAQQKAAQAAKEAADAAARAGAQAAAAQPAASAAMDQTAMSAKAMSAALRGVPAQFTDIAVSIASGQAPLTVFMQQGGQLKDMFGGAGNAARALGGYVLGLVSPLTVAAAAAGVLYLAYEQTRTETAALDMALVKSGNTIGGTVGELQGMAAALHASGAGMGAATAALVTMVESGGVAKDQLQAFTQVAIDLERYGGQSVDKTAKAFKALADEPAAASLKLTASVGALTAAQYEQIKALEEQGRKTDAARIAQQAHADASKTAADAYRANMGPVAQFTEIVAEKALKMWAALRGQGATGDSRLADARKRLAELEQQRDTGFASTEGGAAVGARTDPARLKAQIDAQRELVAYLERTTQAQKDNAEAEAARQRVQQDGIAAMSAVGDAQDKGRTKQEQMNAALEKYRANIEAIRAANPNSALLDPAKVAAGEAAIRAQYTSGDKANKVLERQRGLLADLWGLSTDFAEKWSDLTAVYQRGEMSVDQLAEAQAKLLAQQPAIRAEADAQTKAAKERAKAEEEAMDVQVKAMNALADARTKATRDAAKANDSLRDGNKKLADEVELLGQSEEAQRAIVEARLDATIAAKEQELANLGLGESYTREMALLEEEIELLKERATLQGQKFDGQALDKQLKEEGKAWERFSDSIYDGLTDSLFRAFEQGSSFFDSFWNGIKNTLKTTVLRAAIQLGVSGIGGALGLVGDGATGASGAMNAMKGVSDAYGLYDKGTKAYNWMFGSGATDMTGFYSSGASWLGGGAAAAGALGSGVLGSGTAAIGTGVLGSSAAGGALGTGTALLGEGALTIGGGGAFAASTGAGAAAAAGGGSSAAGAAAGMGPYGWIAAAVILAIAAFAGKGEKRAGGQYGVNYEGDQVTNARRGTTLDSKAGDITFLEGPSGGQFGQDAVKTIMGGTVDTINALFKDMDTDISVASLQAGVETSSKGRGGVFMGGRTNTGLTFGESGANDAGGSPFETTSSRSLKGDEAIPALALDAKQTIVQALQAAMADLPKVIADQVRGVDAEGLTDEAATTLLQTISTQVQGINALRDSLERMPFANLKGLSFDAAAALIELTGGVDNLNGVLSSYQQNFYSAAELTAQATANMQAAFAGLKLDMPDLSAGAEQARAQYRALVEAQDMNTEAGRANWAALMNLAGAFAELTPLTQAAAAATRSAADVARERDGLERQLMQLQGDTAGLRARDLAALDASNRALQEHIWALEDSAKAAEESAQRVMAAGQYSVNVADLAMAHQQAIDAAKKVTEAWQKVNDSLMEEVLRIRGLMDESGEVAAAQAQAAFVVATAQARAGDQDAANQLPQLARAVVAAIEKSAGSEQELRGAQMDTANSLVETQAAIARRQGLKVPSYDVGTSWVPRDGLAMLHEGEAVLTKAENQAGGYAALQSQIRQLERGLAEQRGFLKAISITNHEMMKIARRNNALGQPVRNADDTKLEVAEP